MAAEPRAGHGPEQDGGELRERGRAEQHDECRRASDRGALAVRAERSRHAPHGLGDDGHGDELEPVQHPRAHGSAQCAGAVGKQQQRQCRRQRESQPGGQSTQVARPQQPHGEAHLAAGWPWRELAQRHQVGVALLVDPLPAAHVLLVEIPEMSDRPTERGQSELRRHPEDFKEGILFLPPEFFSRGDFSVLIHDLGDTSHR